ncbi:MAG: segregation ATPase FtsK/SpoIIIE, family [Clostridiales bacterium]|nr:segregation ATPase FtsK/SpoIIIE, family [Clostridiales bacterium]
MASGRKQTTTKKTSTAKKASTTKKPSGSTGTKKTQQKKPSEQALKSYKVRYEIKMIALVAVTLFQLLSLYTEAVGVVGTWLTKVYMGLFSYFGYLMPLIVFVIFFVFLNPNFRPTRIRTTASMVLFSLSGVMAVTLGVQKGAPIFGETLSFWEMIQKSYTMGAEHTGGGVFGGILTFYSVKWTGLVGTFILIVVLAVIAFILFTRMSLQDLWKNHQQATQEKKETQKAVIEAIQSQNAETAALQNKKVESVQNLNSDGTPHFLTQLEAMRRSKKKEALKAFDYDSYEKKSDSVSENTSKEGSKPVLSEQSPEKTSEKPSEKTGEGIPEKTSAKTSDPGIRFYDHVEKQDIKPVANPSGSQPSNTDTQATGTATAAKLKDADIDPATEQSVTAEIEKNVQKPIEFYKMPPLSLLRNATVSAATEDKTEYLEMARLLEETLNNFNVDAKVLSVKRGPAITMFEVQPSPGVKVSKIVGLSDDIALNLATTQVRIAPIPGKAVIGIEVPNKATSMVTFKEVILSSEFEKNKSKLAVGLGKDISGTAIIGDLSGMPHLLIAGATGSGKSVCVNTIICSILYNARPDEVKFLMIDPKVVELSTYNGIPHLILPVVTDPKKASVALNWAVNEMTRRYKLFAEHTVRDMKGYNRKAEEQGLEILPQIVVIIDELSDLMMVAPNQVEDAICRLAQMARAAGIHLIVATQRPSVDVITGLIKANIPSRIAFSVSSSVDSRTIIDMNGAEKLLGKGDMLYYPVGAAKPKRAQGAFVSDEEVEHIVEFIKNQAIEFTYNEEILDDVQQLDKPEEDVDEYLEDAIAFVVQAEQASTSMLQRRFRIGYNRAARLIDSMEERRIIGPARGSKPREVLMSSMEYEALISNVPMPTDDLAEVPGETSGQEDE